MSWTSYAVAPDEIPLNRKYSCFNTLRKQSEMTYFESFYCILQSGLVFKLLLYWLLRILNLMKFCEHLTQRIKSKLGMLQASNKSHWSNVWKDEFRRICVLCTAYFDPEFLFFQPHTLSVTFDVILYKWKKKLIIFYRSETVNCSRNCLPIFIFVPLQWKSAI